jgi:hypothetical protein
MNIEELAFKDRKILANLNAVDLLNIIEFLQDDRRQCLEELSKTHNRSVEIQKKNQELKSQLKGTTHCFDEEEHNKLKEEIRQLKKHLKVPKTYNLKTLEDYKSYYEDTTREQILEDTYIEYCAYVNLAHRYSELKKQIENCYCNRTDCSGRIKDSKVYDSLVQKVETQQKEFIKYLEDVIKELQKIKETELDYDILKDVIPQLLAYEEILQKHKEITQTKNNNSV